MMENGSTKRDSEKSLTLRLTKSKGQQDRKSFTFGRSSKSKSTGIVPPTSIACQSSSSFEETKENNSIDGDSLTSKDALPSEEKFSGQGITFKAKLIGIDPVAGPRGDKMCQSALQRLKVTFSFILYPSFSSVILSSLKLYLSLSSIPALKAIYLIFTPIYLFIFICSCGRLKVIQLNSIFF